MNPEIESCLKKLMDRPSDRGPLTELKALLNGTEDPPADLVSVFDRNIAQHRNKGNVEAVAGLIGLKLELPLGDEARAELLVQQAKLLEEELLDQAGAKAAYERALVLRPDDDDLEEAVEYIEFIEDNWQKAVDKWLEEAASSGDTTVATRLYCTAAETLWRNQRDSDQIEPLLRKSLAEEPRNWRAARHLARLLQEEERYEELTALLQERLEVAGTRTERLTTLQTLGEVYATHLDQPDQAIETFQQVLALDANNSAALGFLVDALSVKEDWQGLVSVYEEVLRTKPSQEVEVGILVQLGLTYDQKLGDADKAEGYFRRVRKYEPTNGVLLDFYRRYYRDRGEANKLLSLLDAAQRLQSEPERRLALAREMAELAENEVGKVDKAIDIWKGIQRMDPSIAEATDALKRLYRNSTPPKWNALRELLRDELERLPDDQVDDKIQLLTEIVEIYRDNLRLDVMVINTYNAILALKPDHEEALAALTDKYQSMGRWNDLIGLLLKRKDVVEDPAEKVALLRQVAGLWEEKFGNHSQAIKPLEEILTIDPLDAEALARLREIHGKRRNWRELIELSRREAEHVDGERRRELLREIAKLATERLGDANEGIQVWNRLLEDDPNDAEALGELAKLYRKVKRWPALAEVLERQAELQAGDDGAVLKLLGDLGELYTTRLDATDNAIDVWQRVLALQPDSRKAREVLRDLFVKQQRWEDLERLFGESGDHGRLADTLSSAADRADDPELKVRLYVRVGELFRDKLANPDRATRSFERARELDAANVAVAQALVPLYRDAEKWSNLLEIFTVLLDAAEETAAKLELLGELRSLCEEKLHSKAKAFEWCAQAFALDPENDGLRAELERLAGEAGEWEELVAIYTDRVSEIEVPEAKAGLLRKLAKLSEEQLHRPEDAEVFYRELLELYPGDTEALEALEHIYHEASRWNALVEIYQRRVALEDDLAARVDLLFKVARIQEENVQDPEAAVVSLNELVAQQPDNVDALQALARLHQAEQSWEALAEVLERKLDLTQDESNRVKVMHQLADTLQTKLEDHRRAIDYFTQVLSLEPGYAPTVEALERYFILEEGFEAEVARLLEPVYSAAENWKSLAQALEIILGDEEDRDIRILQLKRLMEIYGAKLDQPEAAFTAGSALLALNPDDRGVRTEMARLADELDRVEELVELLRGALEALGDYGDPSLELSLNWELAGLLDDRLGLPEDAEACLRRVVEIEPGHRAAYDLLERILRDGGKWAELRDLLAQRKDLEQDPAARRDVLLQICSLNEDFLDDVDAAIEAYEEILQLEPDHGVALKALERHYTDQERWDDLLELLQRETSYVDDDRAINELKYRQADLLARRLSDPAGAVDLLEEVVSLDPELDLAVELLETLMGEADHERRVSEILETVYQRREEYDNLVRILLARRAMVEGNLEAVDLLCRAAALQEERLNDPVNAFECYREALTLEPGALQIHEAVERISTSLEAWQEAADAWSEAYEAADEADLTLRARLQMKLARIYDEKLYDTDKARGAFELLLELEPDDLEIAQPATEALARIYELSEMWTELIGVLRRQLVWEQEPERREALLVKICRIQEEVQGEPEAAVETYRELLQENPGSEVALDALERLYLDAERWSELVEIYRRRVEMATEPERRRDLWLQIAGLYEDQIEDLDQAIAAYLTVLDEVPDELEAIRALARIYQSTERWSDLLDMLERELSLGQADGDEKVELIFRIATIHHRNLGDLAVAVGRYRDVLELAPAHEGTRRALEEILDDPSFRLDAAKLLAPVYQAESNWERLIGIYELQAEEAAGPEKVRLLCQVAQLCEDGLDDAERAFEVYQRVVRNAAAEPELLEHIEQFQRIARNLERWEAFVAGLEDVVLDVMDPEFQRTIYLTAAEVARDHLQDLERSRRLYQSVLDADPDHRGALSALDALYDVLEQWEPLLETVQRRAELAEEEQTQRDFLVRAAVICRDKLDNPDEAVVNFERVLGMFPQDAEAIEALDALYQQTGRWPDYASLLERQLDFVEDTDQRVQLYFRLGWVRADELSEAPMAMDAYQQVLNLDPSHDGAIEALEGYLGDVDLQVEAAHILEPIYKNLQQWEKLIRVYRIRLDAGDESESRITLLSRIAELYEEQLEDLSQAFTWFGKVFLADPASTRTRDQLLRLTGLLENWEDLAGVLATYLDDTLEENETTRDVAILLGTIYDDQLEDVEGAAGCFRRALSADRSDGEAFLLLETLLSRHERWTDLLQLYQEMADATLEPEERRGLLLKICRVWEQELQDKDEAIEAYKAVLDQAEDDAVAVEALDRLYTETERWQDLTELLSRQCDFAADEEQIVALKFRIGAIYEEKLLDLHTAVDHFEEVLARDPNHEGAVAALERIVLDQDQRFRVAQILEQIYKDQGEWAKLIVIYDAELEFIDDRERRGLMLREMARLYEEVADDLEAAFSALCRAFEEEFGDPELLAGIERLAGNLGNWGELVAVLKKGVEGTFDYDLQATIYAKIARLQEEQLADFDAAVESWRQVLAAREDDADARAALIRLLEGLERHEELIEVLQRQAEFTGDPEEQKATYLRIAEIYESLLIQPERAVDTYRQILTIDEADPIALDALERLYIMASNWLELIWVYQRQLELAEDLDKRRELQLNIAQVYEDKLEDGFEAINAYKNLLLDDPADPLILDALDRLYSREELHADLLEIVEAKAEYSESPEARIELLFRAGAILEREIGDLDGAVDRYRRVLDEEPTHDKARAALEELVRGDSHREVVAEILEQLYNRLAEVEPLVEVLELRLEAMADPPARKELLLRIADYYEEGLDDSQGAFDALARALAEDPGDEAVQSKLDALAGQIGNIVQLVQVYEERLDGIYDAMLSRGIHLKLARLLQEVVQDNEGAERHYRAALDFEGDELEPLLALDQLVTNAEKWDDLLEILERELQAMVDPGEQANIYHRIGEIRLREHDDLDGAFAAYRDALERDPGHTLAQEDIERLLAEDTYRVAVLDVLEPIHEQQGNFAKLVELLETRLTTISEPEERVGVLERIATIQEQELDAPDLALAALGRAMAEEPTNEALLDQAEELAERLASFDELVAVADGILEGAVSGEAAEALGLRAARWYMEQLNEVDKAEACLKRVLDFEPECGPALERLEQIYRAGSEFGLLAEILWRRAELSYDPEQKRALLAEVAKLREDALDDAAGAVDAWRGILDLNGEDGEALDALALLFEAEQEWDELLEVLDRKAMRTHDPAEQVGIKHRMGQLLTGELDNVDRAVEVYRDILDLAHDDREALDQLEAIYRGQEDWTAVQETVMRRLELEQPEERVETYFKLAELAAERLEEVEEAADFYREVLNIEPANLEAIGRLEGLLRQNERWYDLVEVLRRHAEVLAEAEDTTGEVTQLVEASKVYNDKLTDPDAAAELLEEILEKDESNVQALAGLARIYESTEQWGRCQEVLQRAAELDPEPNEAAELSFRMGRIKVLQDGDASAAVEHYERALELNPEHGEAAAALEAYAREQEDWAKVAELMELRVNRASEQEQLALLLELGSICSEKLSRPEDSVSYLELARELDPDNVEILAPLADAFYEAERYDDAEPLLRKLMEQSMRGRRKELARYTFRMGTIQEKRGEAEQARESFEKAYKLDSTFGPTLVALGRVLVQQEDWSGARRIYRSMLLQNIDDSAGIAKADVFYFLGLAHFKLDETQKAQSMFERGLEMAPDHEDLQQALELVKA